MKSINNDADEDGLKVTPATATATNEMLQAMKLEMNERQTTYNLAICCIVLFCAEASRGLFIPSLWSCVQNIGMDHGFLSWCIPLFSVGRMFGSYLAGSASDRWHDDGVPTIACLLASIAGGIIYVLADMNRSWMLLLLAEFTMGIGGGTLAVLRAHVSKITTEKMRMSHTTYISTAQFVGLGLMPLAALAINVYFVGPHHHEELAAHRATAKSLLLAGAGGLVADHLGSHISQARSEQTEFTEQAHRTTRSVGGSGGRQQQARYHSGLENSSRAFKRTEIHASKNPSPSPSASAPSAAAGGAVGGRHLLSVSSSTTTAGLSTAVSVVGAGVSESAAPVVIEGTTFLQRLINHRTAPAHLLILLNLICLLLYFMYFDSQHESFEYTAKKKSDLAKKRLADQVRAAKEANGGFDVDDEAGGPSGAFVNAVDKDDTPDAGKSVSTGGGRRKGPVKEIVFDVSKLTLPSVDAAGGVSESSDAVDADGGNVSIVQVRDTTVITLAPFSDTPNDSSSASSSSSTSKNVVTSRGGRGGGVGGGRDVEDANSSSSSSSRSNNGRGRGKFSLAVFARAIVGLFHGAHTQNGAGGASVNNNNPSGSGSGGSGVGEISSTSSQRSRISDYESGSAHVDLDDEGIYLGGVHLTPERMILWGSCLFVYLNYTIRGVLATVETVGTPTLAKFQGIPPGSPLEVEASAKFFGVLGLLGCIVFYGQWYFQDRIDEPTTLIAGFVVTVIGSSSILMFQTSEDGFIFGCVCIWSFGLPAVQNSVLAALSRILGTRPQGTWMGWIQTFGSLGRVTFPLITKIFSVPFAFFLSSLGCGIAILALLIYMKLVKMTM